MSYSARRRGGAAGVTLIEVLVVVTLMAILTMALGYALTSGLDIERAQAARRAQQDRTVAFEQRIATLLRGAKIIDDPDDLTTFFIGEQVGGDGELGCDRLTFTTVAPTVSLAAQVSEDDFEEQQEAQGPVGGIAEVSLSTTAVGDPAGRTGVFERVQRPSDGDPTQGGMEGLISTRVEVIGFQFYDGTEWVNTWDTVTGPERRLPAAVRVSYRLRDAGENDVRSFLVALPTSDVTEQNPAVGGPPSL